MFLILLIATSIITMWMIGPYLLAVTMGGIFALLFGPFYRRLQGWKMNPKTASLLVTLTVFILVIGPISLFITLAAKQGMAMGQALTQRDDLSLQSLLNRISHWRWIESFVGDPRIFDRQVTAIAQGFGRGATTLTLGLLANIPKILLQMVLAGVSCFFLLIDGHRFLHWMTDKIPLDSNVRTKLGESLKNTTVSVIWATFAAAAAQALVILFSFLILGIPAPFLAAGAIFIFAWIPLIGSTPVWISGALYLYFQGAIAKCIAMIVFGLFTGIVDNFVRPLVLKGRGGMHPLVSLISIFGGIQMFGIFGVFLGPILAATLIALLQTWPAVAECFGLIVRD